MAQSPDRRKSLQATHLLEVQGRIACVRVCNILYMSNMVHEFTPQLRHILRPRSSLTSRMRQLI